MKLARRHVAAETVIIHYFEFIDGAEIPRVCLSPSDTVATFTQALAVSLAEALSMNRTISVAQDDTAALSLGSSPC